MSYLEKIDEHIANYSPDSLDDVLGTISFCWNEVGKEVFDKLKVGEHICIGEAAMGYINYSLYYSQKTLNKYCITTGIYDKVSCYTVVENASDFDKYI
jgi:hypothetical protein